MTLLDRAARGDSLAAGLVKLLKGNELRLRIARVMKKTEGEGRKQWVVRTERRAASDSSKPRQGRLIIARLFMAGN
jgi:hypothetical protein